MCTPISAEWEGLNLLPNFQRGGELYRTQIFRGALMGMRVIFFREGCKFPIKNKLKSKVFTDKKVYK